MEHTAISVSQFLGLVNENLRSVAAVDYLIEGEVSDYRVAQQKWVSFDLKDEKQQAVLKCFATIWQMEVPLSDGMRIRVGGMPKVYERFGAFKLNITRVELVGEGALRQAYELLKKRLEQEGLFDPSRKRSLPRFPARIGLITSRDAAAYGDFLRVLGNRWGGIEIDFTPVSVQGREAVSSILGAYAYFNSLPLEDRPEVLVMIRGGGGLEDLHAFNDERVARAVFQSTIPVICGVGHERDESLCDYVADVRASTPSNAAERIIPDRREIAYAFTMMKDRMESTLQDYLASKSQGIAHAANAFALLMRREEERFARREELLRAGCDLWLRRLADQLSTTSRVFAQVDPKRVLSRGYSIMRSGGKVIRTSDALKVGSDVSIELAKGTVDAEVLRVNGKGKMRLV